MSRKTRHSGVIILKSVSTAPVLKNETPSLDQLSCYFLQYIAVL